MKTAKQRLQNGMYQDIYRHDVSLEIIMKIQDEMDKERARSRHEQEQERMEWRKEREALQNKIDQLIAIVAEQSKGKENE
jgi:signal recognition particle GTPase